MQPFNKKLSAGAPEFVPRWARKENTDCFQISLDGYSDDDEPETPKSTVPKVTTTIAEAPPAAVAATPTAAAAATEEEQILAAKDTDKLSVVQVSQTKTGTQRPWRVSRGKTTEVASGFSSMSATDTPKSKLPWRCGSLAQQRVLAQAVPAAGLPPWKRAAAWKPLAADADDDPSSKNQVSLSSLRTTLSSDTIDSGASMSTLCFDTNASEDSADNETTDDTPNSSQEQNASSDDEITDDTPSASGEQKVQKNEIIAQESCESAADHEHAAGDTKEKVVAKKDGMISNEHVSDDTNKKLSAERDEVSSRNSEAPEQEADDSEEKLSAERDDASSRCSDAREHEEKLSAAKDEKLTPDSSDVSLAWVHDAYDTKERLSEEKDDVRSQNSEAQEHEERPIAEVIERPVPEKDDVSVDQHVADDTKEMLKAEKDDASLGNSEAQDEMSLQNSEVKEKFAAEGDEVSSQKSEAPEHEAGDTNEKLIAEDDDVSLQERENSTCETEPEAEEDLLQSHDASSCPEEEAPAVAVCSVIELLKWRSAVSSDEANTHEIPGRLIAYAEPLAELRKPQSPLPRTSLQSRTKQSAVTTIAAYTSPNPSSRRQEAVQQGEGEERDARRSEATKSVEKNKLHASENSWIAKMRARRGQQGEKSDEEVVRAMKGILNKLTIEKFPQLYQQMISCGIKTAGHLEQLIQEVFEKATTQHHFIDMYADLCAHLHSHFKENPIMDSPSTTFKHILLNACQTSFEKNLSPPDNLASLSPEERTAAEFEYKMRTIGNIRLVGALLVRKMLASKVMFAIIEELLSKPTSEALETLAALLTVVGGEFDRPTFANRTALNAIFLQVQALAKKKSTASRVRCLLKDVLDLRAAGWLDKKPKKMEKPTTLGEVHEKAAMENGSPIASTSRASPEEWTTVPQRSAALQPAASVGNASKTFAEAKGRSGIATKAQTLPIKATPDDQLRKENFDSKTCHEEVAKALTELFVSYDIEEAVLCVVDLGVPASHQARELCDVLSVTSEEGSAEKRKIGFTFVAKLFLGGHWRRSALADGLRSFVEDICADLKFDVPNLPQILREELHPALVPAVEAGLLKASQHQSLATPTF